MKNKSFIKPSECDLGENWKDYYLEVKNIKKGDILYECHFGKNIKFKALSNAKRTPEGWTCFVEDLIGKKYNIFMSANTEYYGVNIFRAPQYIEYNEENGYIYPII